MERSSSASPSSRWYDGKTDQPQTSTVRVGPSAVNVISITRRPEGGIVNVEVRRQEGNTAVDQTGSFSSRESSPRGNVVFAKTPPLPIDTSSRFSRGFGGIALHGADTGRLHRALADHVRALHGQSLFDRFNEPAPPFIDSHHHLSHSSSSLSSGRRVHTIPIRIEGRHRPASCPPATTQHQRVYEIPVNVLSSPSKEKPSPAATMSGEQVAKFDSATAKSPLPHGIQQPFPRHLQSSEFDSSSDAERKLASLMSQLETEMNSGSSVTAPGPSATRKQTSEITLTPVAVSTAKSPPPYHGPHITEFYPSAAVSEGKQSAGFVSVAEVAPGSPASSSVLTEQQPGVQQPGVQKQGGTAVRTVTVDAQPTTQTAVSVERYGLCESCGVEMVNLSEACQAMGRLYHNNCFICSLCQRILRGKAFYEVQGKIYCEDDYLRSGCHQLSVKCDSCGLLVHDLVVQALGNSYHRSCFRCSCCNECIDEMPFTVDADKHLLCLPDFYRLHSAKCCVCAKYIVPAEGSEDAVRVVMLNNDYCISCFRCKDCGRQLSDRTDELCYPLLGVLLCLSCHQRRVADTMTPATVTA